MSTAPGIDELDTDKPIDSNNSADTENPDGYDIEWGYAKRCLQYSGLLKQDWTNFNIYHWLKLAQVFAVRFFGGNAFSSYYSVDHLFS